MKDNHPPLIKLYLRACLVEAARPVVLKFDSDWRLAESSGDPAWYGIDPRDPEPGLGHVRDLFLGIAGNDVQVFPQVELPGGRSAHVHLVPDIGGCWVILLDATTDVARQRAVQQLGNEAELSGIEKSRALKRLKRVRSELEQQRSQLQEADALKTALMATLSHEFRTPLTSIFGYLHLLERRLADDKNGTHALRAIRRSATHLQALSENLLEYAREGAGSLIESQPLDLARIAEELRDMFAPLAAEQNLAFELKADVAVQGTPLGDALKLRQIAINLIGNALRYTPQGRVDARLAWDGKQVTIEVRDTGIGVPAAHRERIFEPFDRGDQKGSRGAGLGLAIVKRVIDAMGGRITVDSQMGRGSTFRADVPATGEPSAQPAAAAEPGRAPRGARAIVADDDPDIRDLLRLMLEDQGWKVELARDARETVERTKSAQPDLLVVDVQMPGLSGNAAVYQLRSQGFRGRIITLSATPTTDARNAALQSGADAFLTKPLDLAQFLRTALG